jgi:hypothetical protein
VPAGIASTKPAPAWLISRRTRVTRRSIVSTPAERAEAQAQAR